MPDLRKPIVVLHESFRKLVDKFNVLSNNVGEPLFLKTHNDSDVVTTINEINATFNPFQGKIVYPNDSVPTGAAFTGYDNQGNLTDYPSYTGAQLPSTHLTITTNQHGGQDIDIDAGRDFLVDAVRNINLTGVSFDGDYSGTYINKVASTSLDSVGGSITVTGNSTYTLTTGSNFIQNTTGNVDISASGNFIFDALGDITLDVDGNDIIFKNGEGGQTVTHNLADNGTYTVTAPANYKLDVVGDIILDADGNDLVFRNGNGNDSCRMNLNDNGTFDLHAPSSILLDAAGDIILDADGNDFIFRNNEGGSEDSARFTLSNAGNFNISTLADFTLDVAGDIIIDAGGDNITLKDGGTTRQEYSLGATNTIATTGNRTETVTGNVSDSAAGTYSIGATGNMDIDTRGTHTVNTGSHLSQYVQGNVTLYNTGQFDIDASGDIYLDAGDSDIFFQRNNDTFAKWQMGIDGQPNALQLSVPRGNFQIDAANDIVLDAGDSDIIFKRQGTTFARWQMGIDGYPTYTRQSYPYGSLGLQAATNVTIDAGHDIILEANGGDVFMKDGATEYLRFHHAGGGDGRIDNNGIPVITFSDSDATFENDVVVDRLLDVNAFTHKNGSFSPLSSGTDRYIGTLNTFNNGDGGGGRLIIHDGHTKTTRTVDIAVQNLGGTANIKYAVSGTGANGDCDIQLKYVVRSGEVDKVDFFLTSSGGKSFTQYYYWLTSHLNVDDTAPTSSGATTIDLDDNIGILAKENGYVGIKKTNPLVELDVDGRIAAEAIDVDSADIGNFNIKGSTITNDTNNINLDAAGDIILHAAGDDIKFEGRYNSIDSDRLIFDLGNNNNSVTQQVINRNHILKTDKNFYIEPKEGRVYLRDSASNNRFQVHFTTGTGTEVDVSNGSLTFDVDGDIVLDADGGDVLLKDGGTQFGRFQNTSGNLILKSGDTTAMTFSGANVTMAGQITLPSADLDKSTKTVHGCINELDSDLGTRTSLSSFYDGHKEDIVTALNRVAARVIDIYDENGNLLNP